MTRVLTIGMVFFLTLIMCGMADYSDAAYTIFQLTNNSYYDGDSEINASGQVVWL